MLARTRNCVRRLDVIISSSGTSAPATPKRSVLAPNQGPALRPCALRVMIWHPVSVTAVPKPSKPKRTCRYWCKEARCKRTHQATHQMKTSRQGIALAGSATDPPLPSPARVLPEVRVVACFPDASVTSIPRFGCRKRASRARRRPRAGLPPERSCRGTMSRTFPTRTSQAWP